MDDDQISEEEILAAAQQNSEQNLRRAVMKRAILIGCIAVSGLAAGCPPAFESFQAAFNRCTGQWQLAKLTASDGAPRDYFGKSLSLRGHVAVIGGRSGSAYVSRYDGSQWTEEARLIAPDIAVPDLFGQSVSIDNDVAVVGAPGIDAAALDGGAAYVFRLDGSNWALEAKLTASTTTPYDRFGESVDVLNDVAVIGAPGDDAAGRGSGAAYVFRFDGTDWIEEAKLTASGGLFGYVVAIDDNVVVVRQGYRDGFRSVYVYRLNGSDWVEEARLDQQVLSSSDALAISGDVILAGAVWDDHAGTASGAAYVYRFDGADWVEEAKLIAADAAPHDHFGESIAVMNDVAVVGAPDDDGAGYSFGAAYLFQFDGSTWVQRRKLAGCDAGPFREFGSSVSISNDLVMVGDYGYNKNVGAVYVFSVADDFAN